MLPGSRIGAYEITELIGEGGMGAVYRARDSRLDRDVAIKVVQPEFSDDPERIGRFSREARMLASLSHPHIATIHGLEESEGIRFLVMELVPGATLAQRLLTGPMPVPEALAAGVQIAAAVEAAHDGGVVHRDLKPGNIMLTPAGTVKVLDFGLAKAIADANSGQTRAIGATRTSTGTGSGLVLGTAAYMSPEQARGVAIDRRTDVWAFGCVLYEMLTGRRPFTGESSSDVIVAVLTREPDWLALPSSVPQSIHRLLRRCLEKDMRRRLRDMGDARLEIEDALSGGSGPFVVTAAPIVAAARRGLWPVLAAAGIVLGAVLGWTLKPDPPSPRSAAQFSIALPASDRLSGTDFPAVAISPTETHVVFVASRGGNSQLYVRPLTSMEVTPIAGTDGAVSPFFSPDGQWIGFFSSGKLRKVAVSGGPVRTIADAPIGFGGVWGVDGHITFAANNGSALTRVAVDGGTPQPVTTLDTARGEFSHRWPELLPDGKTIIYAIGTEGSWDDARIVAQAIGGGERHVLVEGGTYPRYLRDGQLLFARGGTLFAVPFDAKTLKVTGKPQRALDSVLQSSDGAAQVSVSASGSVAYVEGVLDDRRVVWVDHGGSVQPLAAPRGPYSSPRVAPDGRSIALVAGGDRDEIWVYNVPSGELRQLTFEGGSMPAWSFDGSRVAFSAARNGPPAVFWRRADGSGGDERLTGGTHAQIPFSASADLLAIVDQDPSGNRDIGLVSLTGDHVARAFRPSPATESAPALSRDGRWVAYVSDEAGSNEVYVAAADGSGPAVRMSTGGGSEPRWHPNGAELFFRANGRMIAVPVRTRPTLAAGAERVLFEGAFVRGSGSAAEYDVSPDGARFLMLEGRGDSDVVRELRVILGGWVPGSEGPRVRGSGSP